MPANDQDTTAPSSTSQPAKGSALANVSALRPALHPSEGGSSYFQPTVSSSLSKEISPNSPSSPHADASQPVSPGTQIPQSPRTGFRQGSIQLGSPDIRRMSLNVPGSPMPRDGRGRLLARSLKRGMTFDQVQIQGILDEEEKGGQFDDLPLDDKEIKKLPKKVRPYYEHLATLKDHYQEVDALLSGELPETIANSFQRPQDKSYTHLRTDLAGEAARDESDGQSGGHRENGHTVGAGGTGRRHKHRKHGKSNLNGDAEGRRGSQVQNGRGGSGERGRGGDGDEERGLVVGLDREEKRERIARIALNVNTIVNILLVAAKVVAVLYSSSISLLASLVDSALDTFSTFIILATSWAIGIKSDRHLYPTGKRRFEPLGVLIFSVAMIASFVQVFIEAFNRARENSDEPPVDLSRIGLSTMLATIGVKSVLWIWCSRIPSSGVQALAQDAENDVWLNIMSLAFPWIGEKVGWRLLDPIGGMILSSYIIIEWVKTLLSNFANLSGRTASRDQITRVLYLVTRFNPVLEIGDIECYHIGDDLIVEVDVILPDSSSLHFAHDVSETIQCVLESLDGVLRAYVSADYSSENPIQHVSRIPQAIDLPSPAMQTESPSGSLTPTNKRLGLGEGLMQNGFGLPSVAENVAGSAVREGVMEGGGSKAM